MFFKALAIVALILSLGLFLGVGAYRVVSTSAPVKILRGELPDCRHLTTHNPDGPIRGCVYR